MIVAYAPLIPVAFIVLILGYLFVHDIEGQ